MKEKFLEGCQHTGEREFFSRVCWSSYTYVSGIAGEVTKTCKEQLPSRLSACGQEADKLPSQQVLKQSHSQDLQIRPLAHVSSVIFQHEKTFLKLIIVLNNEDHYYRS